MVQRVAAAPPADRVHREADREAIERAEMMRKAELQAIQALMKEPEEGLISCLSFSLKHINYADLQRHLILVLNSK